MSTPAPSAVEGAAPQQQGEVSGAEIKLTNVTKTYKDQPQPAVNNLSLTIPAGEIVMFVGPSGCGKTTSLKMINRLIEPTSGTITMGGEDTYGQDLDDLRRRIGYVIQGGSLFPHMTVAQNIGLVPGMLKWDKKKTSARVEELLDLVGLDPGQYRDRYPRELSGGQQQRVGVARGLAADPPAILMDEPFGAVDPITRARLQDELLNIQAAVRKTIICVTHDIDEAIKLGDRILILKEGANIAQYDTPEHILAAPANDFVADFVGAGSTLKQLSLARAGELDLKLGVTAHLGDSVVAAKQRAHGAGEQSIIVLDEHERPIGWVWLRALVGDTVKRPEQTLNPVGEFATLNDALDTMLESTHGGTIVVDRHDRYMGIATFDQVTGHVRKTTAEAEKRIAAQQETDLRDHETVPS